MESSVSLLRIVGRKQFPSVCSSKTEFSEMVPELALDSRSRNEGRDQFVHISDWVLPKSRFSSTSIALLQLETVSARIHRYSAGRAPSCPILPPLQRLNWLRHFTPIKCRKSFMARVWWPTTGRISHCECEGRSARA